MTNMLLATICLPPGALALEHTAGSLSDIKVEAERIAAYSTEWVMPCLWVSHADFDTVDDAFNSDPSIKRVVESTRFDDAALYHVEWAEAVARRIDSYIDREGSILDARFENGEWHVEFRFASREQFDTFREQLSEHGHSFRLIGLSEPETPRQGNSSLTSTQRDILVTAAESGYFRVPREITMEDLAAEYDVSHQAISELLRRGIENLVLSTLTTGGETGNV